MYEPMQTILFNIFYLKQLFYICMFGDIDPNNPKYVESLLVLLNTYSKSKEGFLRRRDRPELFKSNILGRLPSIKSKSSIVTNL